METAGRFLLFGGLLIAFISQVYIALLAFKRSFSQGIFCLIVPAYILFFAMRAETRQAKALLAWGIGLAAFIVGIATLS